MTDTVVLILFLLVSCNQQTSRTEFARLGGSSSATLSRQLCPEGVVRDDCVKRRTAEDEAEINAIKERNAKQKQEADAQSREELSGEGGPAGSTSDSDGARGGSTDSFSSGRDSSGSGRTSGSSSGSGATSGGGGSTSGGSSRSGSTGTDGSASSGSSGGWAGESDGFSLTVNGRSTSAGERSALLSWFSVPDDFHGSGASSGAVNTAGSTLEPAPIGSGSYAIEAYTRAGGHGMLFLARMRSQGADVEKSHDDICLEKMLLYLEEEEEEALELTASEGVYHLYFSACDETRDSTQLFEMELLNHEELKTSGDTDDSIRKFVLWFSGTGSCVKVESGDLKIAPCTGAASEVFEQFGDRGHEARYFRHPASGKCIGYGDGAAYSDVVFPSRAQLKNCSRGDTTIKFADDS